MRVALIALVSAGCIPRLYSTDKGEVPSEWIAPENSWGLGTPPGSLEGEGFDEGQVAPDFRLVDQHGDEVSLWQFYGKVILLDVSTIWCGPCQQLAEDTESTWGDYRDDGFVYLTILQEDFDGAPPDGTDLDFWADSFGITAPVLGDGDKTGLPVPESYPALRVVGREMRVRELVDPPDDEHVRAAIESAL